MCDKRITVRLNGKFYKTFVGPVTMCRLEFLALAKKIEQCMSVIEMNILRWISRVNRDDQIRNGIKVPSMVSKMKENKFK